MKRNCSLQTSDKRKISGMTPNVGDFDHDGFADIYVTEWLPQTLGKVMVIFEPNRTISIATFCRQIPVLQGWRQRFKPFLKLGRVNISVTNYFPLLTF